MFKKDPVYTITSLENQHPRAARFGQFAGRVALPLGFLAGTAYVVAKTKNV